MSLDIAAPHPIRFETSNRRFFDHYLEMIAVMLVAMVMLGGVVSLVFGVVGHSNILHYAGLRAFVMTANMTIGVMLRRYNEYAQDHRSHSTGHVATSNA
jgi:hypothetical protein